MVQVVEVFYVFAQRGNGTPGDPHRNVHLYYSKQGDLLACYDPINGAPDAVHPMSTLIDPRAGPYVLERVYPPEHDPKPKGAA